MKDILRTLLILIIATLTFSCSDDKTLIPSVIHTPEELTNFLEDICNDSKTPGFAISIVKDESIIYKNAFGSANIEASINYTNNTAQPIASISKTFIAAAIIKASSQGYFTLETNINDVLPFEIINPKLSSTEIKIKHLVTHTSSIVDENSFYFNAYHILLNEDLTTDGSQVLQHNLGFSQRDQIPLETFLTNYFTPSELGYSEDNFSSAPTGSYWQYSNIASSLAAFIVEYVSGMSFEEYVTTYVLQPLEMNQTSYQFSDFNDESLATLYWNKNTPLPKYENDSYPDGGLISTNNDMSKYLLDMIKGYNGNSSLLFEENSYQQLFDPILPNGMVPTLYGKNNGTFWFHNNNYIEHSGSDPGTTCLLRFSKSGDSGFLILTNSDASTSNHKSEWFTFQIKIIAAINAFLATQ